MSEIQRLGRHRQPRPVDYRPTKRYRRVKLVIAMVTVLSIVSFAIYIVARPSPVHTTPQRAGIFAGNAPLIGVYTHDSPASYTGITAFTSATSVKPNIVVYYSGWLESFQIGFAATAAREGAVPLIQMNPTQTDVTAIASGQYDTYLRAYAESVRAYGHPILVSFGHEMNGSWYTWGYKHTSPRVFVAAWRHIVTLFRETKAQNVTWVWTINTIHKKTGVPSPGPWWPGKSYVNWVGIDGYYTAPSSVFASVFGPTIVYLRTLTHAPIIITETSATPIADQPAKVNDLFAGIHLYDLLGFVWFDSIDRIDWRLSNPAAIAAFRHDARIYQRRPHE